MGVIHELNFTKPVEFNYRILTNNENWEVFHTHHGMEFLYIHEGTGNIILDQKIYPIEPRMLIYFQPHQLHGTKAIIDDSTTYTRTILLMDPTFLTIQLQSFPELKNFFNHLWHNQLDQQILYIRQEDYFIETLMKDFYEKSQTIPTKDLQEELVLFALSYLHNLKHLWQTHHNSEMNNNVRPSKYAEQIMQWIELHYFEEFKLKSLSADLHISEYHLSHLFKSTVGTSITEYLIERRIGQACFLLRTTSHSVGHISHEIGLTNQSYFCQLFKKKMNISPYKYRKQFLNVKC